MNKWLVKVNETVEQETVYCVEADSKEKAEEIVRNQEGEMELLSYYEEERTLNTILSVEPYEE
jgi:hypothetical protein